LKRKVLIISVIAVGILICLLLAVGLLYRDYMDRDRSIAEDKQPQTTPRADLDISVPEATVVPAAIKVLKRWPEPTVSPVYKGSGKPANMDVIVNEPAKRYLIKIAKHELFKYYGVFSFTKDFIPVFSQSEDETLTNFDLGLYDEDLCDDRLICGVI
jgi:hypothetical protein